MLTTSFQNRELAKRNSAKTHLYPWAQFTCRLCAAGWRVVDVQKSPLETSVCAANWAPRWRRPVHTHAWPKWAGGALMDTSPLKTTRPTNTSPRRARAHSGVQGLSAGACAEPSQVAKWLPQSRVHDSLGLLACELRRPASPRRSSLSLSVQQRASPPTGQTGVTKLSHNLALPTSVRFQVADSLPAPQSLHSNPPPPPPPPLPLRPRNPQAHRLGPLETDPIVKPPNQDRSPPPMGGRTSTQPNTFNNQTRSTPKHHTSVSSAILVPGMKLL